jgi:hypothetical protein
MLGKLGEIYPKIMAGKPDTFDTIRDAFTGVSTSLEVAKNAPEDVKNLGESWTGAAAKGFSKVSTTLDGFVKETATALTSPSYRAAMDAAKQALVTAQKDIQSLADQWNNLTKYPNAADMKEWDKAAEDILKAVSDVYTTQRDNLTKAKDVPGEIDKSGGTGTGKDDHKDQGGDGNDEKGAGGDDAGADGSKGTGAGGDDAGAGGPTGAAGDGGPGDGGPGDGAAVDGGSSDSGLPGSGGPGSGSDDPAVKPDRIPGIGDPSSNGPTSGLTLDGPGAGGSPGGGGHSAVPTDLQSFDPAAAGGTGPGASTSLTSASGGGLGSPGGPGAGGGGTPSQLTSAGPYSGSGGPGLGAAGLGARSVPVGSSFSMAGVAGRSRRTASRRRRGARGVGGFEEFEGPEGIGRTPAQGEDADDEHERESWLLGDDEWDDADVPDASIGCPAGDR